MCQYYTVTKREQQRHAVCAYSKWPFYAVSRNILSWGLEPLFYLPLNVMDVVQLLVRFTAVDDVCFVDRVFVFRLFMNNVFSHSL